MAVLHRLYCTSLFCRRVTNALASLCICTVLPMSHKKDARLIWVNDFSTAFEVGVFVTAGVDPNCLQRLFVGDTGGR